MNLLRYAAIALVGLVAIPAARVDAGSEKVAFPANFKSGVLYNVIAATTRRKFTSNTPAVKPSMPPRLASPCPRAR
jgi:hypothetical protein